MASSTECPLFPKPRKGTTGPVQPEVGAVLRSSLKDRFPIFMFHPSPLTGVEATLVALTPSDQEPFLVASIYAPPGPNYRNLGADLDGIFNIFKSAFLAGDYNAKHTSWDCNYSDPRDDTAILSRHRNLETLVENINEHLAHLETWFSVWKIALNSSKTEAVFFSKRKPPLKLLYKIKEYPGLNTPSILV
ncbi:hypothetical protein TNCV_2759001 [Trichonephila clavipes]|nr:hypothetical protein TNCV_2759001 [Trichonephila clavipes]